MASFIPDGKIIDVLMLLFLNGSAYLFLQMGKQGKTWKMRTLPALEGLKEGVARSAEMGKPVTWTEGHPMAGGGRINNFHLAGITLLSSLARFCARQGVRLNTLVGHPQLLPLVEETVRSAFLMEGRPEDFRPDDMIFLPQQSYLPALCGNIARLRPGMHVSAGSYFYQDGMMGPETAQGVGAFQVAAGPVSSLPFFVMTSDYVLFGDEFFAARAMITGDKELLGSVVAKDMAKYLILALSVLGSLLAAVGVNILVDLMKM